MLDFTGVKAITIPEGKAKKITRKSDGVVLWEGKSGYTNLLPLATDTDRNTIFNGKGYITGYRISGSSGNLSQASEMCASGFITGKVGDVLRIKGAKPKKGTASYVLTYNNSNVKVGYKEIGQDDSTTPPPWVDKDLHIYGYGCANYDKNTDILTIILDSATFGTGWNAIRFSAGTITDDTIVTINEEITI